VTSDRGSADHWRNRLVPRWLRSDSPDLPDADLNLLPTSSAPVDEVQRRLAGGQWENDSDQPRRRAPRNRSTVPAGRLGVLATNQRQYQT